MSEKKAAGAIEWMVCEEGHVHLTFHDANGNAVFSSAMSIDFWADLADEIDEAIDEMIDAAEESEGVTKH